MSDTDNHAGAEDAGGEAKPLAGKLCLVAGASRGVGRGIAIALGEAGATVIATGRSTRFGYRTEGRRETVEDTVEDICEAGGSAYPYICDHTDTKALQDMAGWLLRRHGAPDIVVSAVWGGNEGFDGHRYADGTAWGTPFWQRGLDGLERALDTGVVAWFATMRALAPLMIKRGTGLIVTVGFDSEGAYLGDPWYDIAKSAVCRASRIAADELKSSGIAAIHLSPGLVATERVLEAGHETEESPLYCGRAVVALAADPDVMRHSGRSLFAADLARDYDFTDHRGGRPERFKPGASETEDRTS